MKSRDIGHLKGQLSFLEASRLAVTGLALAAVIAMGTPAVATIALATVVIVGVSYGVERVKHELEERMDELKDEKKAYIEEHGDPNPNLYYLTRTTNSQTALTELKVILIRWTLLKVFLLNHAE